MKTVMIALVSLIVLGCAATFHAPAGKPATLPASMPKTAFAPPALVTSEWPLPGGGRVRQQQVAVFKRSASPSDGGAGSADDSAAGLRRTYWDRAEVLLSDDLAHIAVIEQHGRKQRMVVDGREGPEYDRAFFIQHDGLRFGPTSMPVLYAGTSEGRYRLVTNGKPGPQCDAWMDAVSYGPDRTGIAYTAVEFSRKAFVAVDGQDGAIYDDVSCPMISADRQHLAYIVCKGRGQGHREMMVIDGRPGPEYDQIALPASGTWNVFGPEGRHIAYAARLGEKWRMVLDGKPGDEYDEIVADSVAFSPDGQRVAYAARTGSKWRAVVAGQPGPAFDAIGHGQILFLSDGNRIAYAARDGGKWLVVSGNQRQEVCDEIAGLAASPVARHLVYVGRKGGKWRAFVDGQPGQECEQIGLPDTSRASHDLFWFSPDGKRVAYACSAGSKWHIVVDGRPGEAWDEVQVDGGAFFSPDGKRTAYTARLGTQWSAVIDGRAGPQYDEVAASLLEFSEEGTRTAYAARRADKWLMVIDGSQGEACDELDASSRVFTLRGTRTAYMARHGKKWVAVVNGKAGPQYDDVSEMIYSPDGRRLAYVATLVNGTEHDRSSFEEVGKNCKESLVLDGEAGPWHDRIGTYFVCGRPKHLATEIPFGHRLPVKLSLGHRNLHGVTFSRDGKHIAYTAWDGEVIKAFVDGTVGPSYAKIDAPAFSDDGKRLAYVAADKDNPDKCFVVVDGQRGSAYDEIELPGEEGVSCFGPGGKLVVYAARNGTTWRAVVDGKEGRACDTFYGSDSVTSDGTPATYASRRCVGWQSDSYHNYTWGYGRTSFRPLFYGADGGRVAYAGIVQTRSSQAVVVDGQSGPQYDRVTKAVSSDGRHIAYVAFRDQGAEHKALAVIDGHEGPECAAIPLSASGKNTWEPFSPDGRRTAYMARTGGKWRVFVDGQAGPEYDAIRPASVGSWGGFFGPDGKRTAYFAKRGSKWRAVIDGQEGPEFDAVAGNFLPLGFSPDGKRVAYVAVWAGKFRAVIDGELGPEYENKWTAGVVFSPDSRRTAYVGKRDGKQFVVLDGKELAPYDTVDGIRLLFSPDSKRLAYVGYRGPKDTEKSRMVVDDKEGPEYDGPIYRASFSPDSKRLAYVPTLRRSATQEGGERLVVDGQMGPTGGEIDQSNVKWSFDGRRLAYLARGHDIWTAVVDGKQGPAYTWITNIEFSPDGQHVVYMARPSWTQCQMVRDGQPGPTFDGIETPPERYGFFTADGQHVLYQAKRGGKCMLVLDDQVGPEYDSLLSTWFHLDAPGSRPREERAMWVLRYLSDGAIQYPAFKAGELYIVTQWPADHAKPATQPATGPDKSPEERGRDRAALDIKAGKLRILYYGKPWSVGKPLIDDASGLAVEIVEGCDVASEFVAETDAYNIAMRQWVKSHGKSLTTTSPATPATAPATRPVVQRLDTKSLVAKCYGELTKLYTDLAAGADRAALLAEAKAVLAKLPDHDDTNPQQRTLLQGFVSGLDLALADEQKMLSLPKGSTERLVAGLLDSTRPNRFWIAGEYSYSADGRWADGTKDLPQDVFDQIVTLGDKAVPRLIEHLDDKAPSRAFLRQWFYHDSLCPLPHLMKVNELALCLIEQISGCYFERTDDPAICKKHVARWWSEVANKPKVERLKWQFPYVPRILMDFMFKELVALDQHGFLKAQLLSRYEAAKKYPFPQIECDLLARLGEYVAFDRCADALNDTTRLYDTNMLFYLFQYGGPKQYQSIAQSVKARSKTPHEGYYPGQVLLTASEEKGPHVWIVLEAFLGMTNEISGQEDSGWHRPVDVKGIRYCDAAMYELVKRGRVADFDLSWPMARRDAAIKAYVVGSTTDPATRPASASQSATASSPATAPATLPTTLPADDPRRGAVVTLETDKEQYFLGENVLLHWRIRNGGDEPFKISMGGNWQWFFVEAVDQDGRRVDPHPSDCWGINDWICEYTLKPGQEFSRLDPIWGTGETLHLMQYRQFSRPGTYTISVYHDLGWEGWKVDSSATSSPATAWGDIPKSHLAPVATATIRLDMPDAKQARKVVESYHDYEFLSYPVYLPIVKELAQKGDAGALDALGVMMFPEATAALVELLGHKDPAIAAKAWDVLAKRAISLDWRADKRAAEDAWTDELKRAALVPAWKLLDANDRDKIIQGARVVQALGSKDDLPTLIKIMNRVLPLFKDDAVEQSAFLRPATASGALDGATSALIHRGARPPASADTPGQAVAFMIGLGRNADFRPDGWRKLAVGLIDHPIPYLRDVALRNMPLPLDDATTAAVGHAMKDKFAPVQAAACDLATKAKLTAFGSPAIDVLKSTDNEWVLRAAFYAAGACGVGNDIRLEVCVGLMKPLTSHQNYLALDLLIGGSFEQKAFSGYGYSGVNDWTSILPGIQKAWLAFIVDNRQALQTGKLFSINEAPVKSEMFPPGFGFHRQGKPDWLPPPLIPLKELNERAASPATAPVARPGKSAATSQSSGADLAEHEDELADMRRDQLRWSGQDDWFAFEAGVEMLRHGKPWQDVLAQWEKTLDAYPKSRHIEQLQDYVTQLREQVKEEKELARTEVKDLSTMPATKRAQYYIARFPQVRGEQWSQPGFCKTVGGMFGTDTHLSDAVVALGRPAVPELIKHLNDGRLTRSVGFSRFFDGCTVLKVQDVALECIEHILDIYPCPYSTKATYFSAEDAAFRQAAIADIKDWWDKYGDKPPIQGLIARLDKGTVTVRLDVLQKIEHLDPKAVDSVAALKRWAKEAKTTLLGAIAYDPAAHDSCDEMNFVERFPKIVVALAERGDFSLMPEISRAVRQQGVWHVNEDYLAAMVLYGSPGDIDLFVEQMHKYAKQADLAARLS